MPLEQFWAGNATRLSSYTALISHSAILGFTSGEDELMHTE